MGSKYWTFWKIYDSKRQWIYCYYCTCLIHKRTQLQYFCVSVFAYLFYFLLLLYSIDYIFTLQNYHMFTHLLQSYNLQYYFDLKSDIW